MILKIFIICIIFLNYCLRDFAAKIIDSSSLSCSKHKLVKYRAIFQADWSEKKFPKQYPSVRPPAQWSKMIGRSHNADYELYTVGNTAKTGLKKFVQDDSSDLLDKSETQGFDGVYDTFCTPPLSKGVGEMDADFFAAESHPLVSLATSLIPSPDWFAGLAAISLCPNGTWIKEIRLAVDLLDAGIDQGFTFTSPKWASRPQEPVTRITSQHPNHRASSFYYPNLKRLPHIGHVTFELLADFDEHKIHKRVKNYRDDDEKFDLNYELQEKRREKLEEQQILHGEPVGRNLPSASEIKNNKLENQKPMSLSADFENQNNTRKPKKVKQQIKKYDFTLKNVLGEDNKFGSVNPVGKKSSNSLRKDCSTTDWSNWTQCSKTCGFGVQRRFRKVTQVPVQGKPCPNLAQEKWCGGMRNCRDEMKLFSWLNRNSKNE